MKLVLKHDRALLWHGDSAKLIDVLPAGCVDALICDPPAGIGFMGKAWDKSKGGRDQWIKWLADLMSKVRRLMKPGAHGLVWALPRTSHWTGMALELAGFEVRDRVSHLFGTGFPKSMNLGKAIDKRLGKERKVIGPGASNCPDLAEGRECSCYLTRTETSQSGATKHTTTAPGSPEASAWEGWGTALKPACEDWWLVRNPLDGTVAANVLEHGTGGLNIDGCRIGTTKDIPASPAKDRVGQLAKGDERGRKADTSGFDPNTGRWPAHLVLDPEAAAMLDAQAGPSKSTKGKPRKGKAGDGYGMTATGAEYSDSVGPSRFFYVAKPTSKERDAGLEAASVEPMSRAAATARKEGSKGSKNPRAGAGGSGRRNTHPTVKSIALMRWLVRLITPPGGTVLDPFTGSGSTAVAALAEGASFIGCEMGEAHEGEITEIEDRYIAIAKARIEHALKGDSK